MTADEVTVMAFKHSPDADGIEAGKVEVLGRIVRETSRAVMIDDGTSQEWLPKSKVIMREAKGGLVEVLMPEWLARRKRYV